jgi:hypothetical protein
VAAEVDADPSGVLDDAGYNGDVTATGGEVSVDPQAGTLV